MQVSECLNTSFETLHSELGDDKQLLVAPCQTVNPAATESSSTSELVELKVYVRKGGKLKYTLGE